MAERNDVGSSSGVKVEGEGRSWRRWETMGTERRNKGKREQQTSRDREERRSRRYKYKSSATVSDDGLKGRGSVFFFLGDPRRRRREWWWRCLSSSPCLEAGIPWTVEPKRQSDAQTNIEQLILGNLGVFVVIFGAFPLGSWR